MRGDQLKSFDQLSQSLGGPVTNWTRRGTCADDDPRNPATESTKKQTALETQWQAVSRLEQQGSGRWRQRGGAVPHLGISAGGGMKRRIYRETDRYNKQLAEQERRLQDVGERQRKLNAVRAKADKMRDVRNSGGGNGAGMMAAGVTTGACCCGPIRLPESRERG